MEVWISESNHPAKNGSGSENRKAGPEILPFLLQKRTKTLHPSKDESFYPPTLEFSKVAVSRRSVKG